MTPEQFQVWSQILSEASLLVDRNGRILATNNGKRLKESLQPLVGKLLTEVSNTPKPAIEELLRLASRSRQPMISALKLSFPEQAEIEFRCDGMLVHHDPAGIETRLLLKLTPKEAAVRAYRMINEKIDALNREVQRRTQAEEELKRQNEYLRVTLTSIGDAVIVTDAAGRVSLLNQVAENLTGWSTAEASGLPLDEVFRIVGEASDEPVESPALRALREGAIVGLANHTILIARDGTRRPIDDSAAPIRGVAGKTLGAVLVFRDITARRESESEILRQQQMLETITNNTPSMLFMVDSAGRTTYVNQSSLEITGFSREELLGKVLHEKIHHSRPNGEPYPMAECPLENALPRHQSVVRHEDFFVRKDGTYLPVRCSASPILLHGQSLGTVLEVQDISAERANLEALKQSEARFGQLADSIPQLAWMAHPDGYIDWYNNRWLEYTGSTRQQMEGWGWQSVHDPEQLPKVLEKWRESLATGKPFSMVFPLRGRDGKFRPFLTRVMPFRDADGKISRWFGTNTDISEQKALEEELRSIAARLSEADRRKDEFLATLAHELRNPLSPIRTGLEVMKMVQDDPETLEEIRSTMERQALQLVALIDDLMDVSRISSGKVKLRLEKTELAAVLQSAIESVQPFIDEQGHELITSAPQEPVWLHADPHRLAQVVSNLLNNAAKYTAAQGRIWLTVLETAPGRVTISVKDTGEGIPADMRENIFEMFTQVDRSLEKTHAGLGIGLTLVRSLVQMHKGTVEAHSEGPGQGSEFVVELPILQSPPEAGPEAETDPPVSKKRRILVVDDNVAAADTLRALLDYQGHEVRMAHDGLEGFEVARAFLPQLVLMDLGMPRLNGYEAAARMRAEEWGKNLTLVAITGWGQEQDLERTAAAGFDRHLVKPVDPGVIQTLILELDGG